MKPCLTALDLMVIADTLNSSFKVMNLPDHPIFGTSEEARRITRERVLQLMEVMEMPVADSEVAAIATIEDTLYVADANGDAKAGTIFLKEKLWPAYLRADTNRRPLVIDLNGAHGYASSFLEAAFGGFGKTVSNDRWKETLCFICDDEPSLIEEVLGHIEGEKEES